MNKRLSRGTPAMLSVEEQKLLVSSADSDPLMKRGIEILIGRKWEDLTFGQRLIAVSEELQKARGAALMVQALNVRSDLQRRIDIIDGVVSLEEALERTQVELEVTRRQLSEANAITALTQAAAELPPRSDS